MGKENIKVILDMDDVVNQFLDYLLEVYNKKYDKNVKLNDITSWDLTKNEAVRPSIIKLFKKRGFFLSVPEKRGAIEVIKKLMDDGRYDIYIVTACGTVNEYKEKIEWMENYLPEFNKSHIIMCTEKNLIRGDVIVDDKVQNLDECAPYYKKCILYDMPHNRYTHKYDRILTLKELPDILEREQRLGNL